MSAPQLNERWARLFGLIPPPAVPVRRGALPPVPHALYGLSTSGGNPALRRAKRVERMDGIVAYLCQHGGMRSDRLAEAFGISHEVMINDLRLLRESKRIRRANDKKPYVWEAV